MSSSDYATPVRASTPLVLGFGVLLPVVALLVELTTGMSAGAYFDPTPTPGHAPRVAFVPLANFLVWQQTTGGGPRHRSLLGWLNAVAVGIALCYALLFLPFTPVGIIGVVAF